MHPEREAVVHAGARITYGELAQRSGALAAAMRSDLGVRPGDVVVSTLPSSIDFVVTYLAAIRCRAITSAINTRLGASERKSIIDRTEPRLTIVPTGSEALPPGAGRVLHAAEIPLLVSGAPRPVPAAPAHDPPAHDPPAHDPVAIVWTSGTTGAPKGAVYDHAALRAIHAGMGDLTHPGDRRLVSLPFAHVGFMTRIYDEIVSGTTLVIVGEPWSAAEQLRLIESERITMATGVPTQWTLVLAQPDLATTDVSTLRLAGIGGAAVDPALVRAVREALRCPVMHRYTSTEAGLATGTRLGDPDEVVAQTVGVASPVVTLRLVDPASGADVTGSPGTVGEIRLRSPAMFCGYWRDPELSAAALDDDGFLRTGDLGTMRSGGNLRIVGRLKEMYIRGGYNVYPSEVEGVLADHPAVTQAAVVAAAAAVLGEIGVAFVVLAPGAPAPSLAELRDWCADRLADYKSPDRLVIVDSLPVNAGHKIDKQALASAAKEQV